MEKKLDPQHLDVAAFARDGLRLQGEGALAGWPRLAEEQHGDTLSPGQVHWQLQGRSVPQSGAPDQLFLDLKASLMLPMQCQRCLNPVLESVQADRSFLFVADESAAQALDDELEDDVLVISRDFDAMALVEDELILSLPLVPLHQVCPEALPMSVADPAFEAAAERPNPFGVLASLKKGSDH
jgi:uncharacterized protein